MHCKPVCSRDLLLHDLDNRSSYIESLSVRVIFRCANQTFEAVPYNVHSLPGDGKLRQRNVQ
jgi:hypothetical protein